MGSTCKQYQVDENLVSNNLISQTLFHPFLGSTQVLRAFENAEKKGKPALETLFEDIYKEKAILRGLEEELMEHLEKYPGVSSSSILDPCHKSNESRPILVRSMEANTKQHVFHRQAFLVKLPFTSLLPQPAPYLHLPRTPSET